MHAHVGRIDALHAADGDAFGLVLVLVARFPEGLGGAVREATDHRWPAGGLDVHHAGEVLQTGDHTELLEAKAVGGAVRKAYLLNQSFTVQLIPNLRYFMQFFLALNSSTLDVK